MRRRYRRWNGNKWDKTVFTFMEIRKNKESMMVYGRMYEGMYGGMEGHTLVVTNVEDEEEEGAS